MEVANNMDHTILKKRLETYKTSNGKFRNVADDVLIDVLRAWESWNGSSGDFYSEIGVSGKQFSKLLGNAKKANREGRGGDGEFKEITLEALGSSIVAGTAVGSSNHIELCWEHGKVIRFPQVEQLLDFLKKVA